MPTRFSYDDLNVATENFTKKFGEGGFESVFEGCLEDDTKIAVKCLDEIGQVKKSFLAKAFSIRVHEQWITRKMDLPWKTRANSRLKLQEEDYSRRSQRKKAEEERLVGLINKHSEDMQFYKEEVIKTMKIAAWCLQSDYTKRPSMSMVVKAMEVQGEEEVL
ncbi:hypothetical protein T459_24845 [Capsicum annuum]|uniref:Uncharacterized protein n=1 Tax=Capsicum annuum TaxID=4072 RepID=A0A2G2YJH2_CAPAN|nr:hypothetical protein T459_24845 [Capsicum annuum]